MNFKSLITLIVLIAVMAGCSAKQTHDKTAGNSDGNKVTNSSDKNNMAEDMGEAAKDAADGTGEAVKDVGDGVGNAVENVTDGVGEAVKDAGDGMDKATKNNKN